jgi:RsiW-degrading membrane proteinase PrsW (M82 family)
MDITQTLALVVIAVEVVLILISLYLYNSLKLRIFYFLTGGFVALLLACVIQAFIGGNTGIYTNVLDIAAGLFFITGALTAV